MDFVIGAALGVIGTAFAGAAFSARVRSVFADLVGKVWRRAPQDKAGGSD